MRRSANRHKFHQAPPEIAEHWHAGCGGKRQYPDFSTANRMAKTTSRNIDEPMQPYRCMFCSRWHVGTSPPKEATRKRAKEPAGA